MTDRYVNPAVGSSGTGDSWAQAYKTLKEATDAAAANETIYFATGTANTITTSTTYTFASGVKLISTSDTTNSPPTTYATGAKITSTTFGVEWGLAGALFSVYGVIFETSNDGTTTASFGYTANSLQYYENCTFSILGSSGNLHIGGDGTSIKAEIRTKNCTFLTRVAGATLSTASARWESCGDSFFPSGAVPTIVFVGNNGSPQRTGSTVKIIGGNLSTVNTTLVKDDSAHPATYELSSCLLHASVTFINSVVAGGVEITLFDCSYDNAGTLTGQLLYHENYLGSTSISTAIYANDGAQYDGTNRCSWVVDGKAAATFLYPYVSPWIDVYNDDVSTSITPYLECVRSGSATAYTDALVWAEFAARDTANSPRLSITQDRTAPLATAANQTASSLGAGDWTGENATSWFGKLVSLSAFTPDEVGYMRARICVVGDNTVYVDPQLRGLA